MKCLANCGFTTLLALRLRVSVKKSIFLWHPSLTSEVMMLLNLFVKSFPKWYIYTCILDQN